MPRFLHKHMLALITILCTCFCRIWFSLSCCGSSKPMTNGSGLQVYHVQTPFLEGCWRTTEGINSETKISCCRNTTQNVPLAIQEKKKQKLMGGQKTRTWKGGLWLHSSTDHGGLCNGKDFWFTSAAQWVAGLFLLLCASSCTPHSKPQLTSTHISAMKWLQAPLLGNAISL